MSQPVVNIGPFALALEQEKKEKQEIRAKKEAIKIARRELFNRAQETCRIIASDPIFANWITSVRGRTEAVIGEVGHAGQCLKLDQNGSLAFRYPIDVGDIDQGWWSELNVLLERLANIDTCTKCIIDGGKR